MQSADHHSRAGFCSYIRNLENPAGRAWSALCMHYLRSNGHSYRILRDVFPWFTLRSACYLARSQVGRVFASTLAVARSIGYTTQGLLAILSDKAYNSKVGPIKQK